MTGTGAHPLPNAELAALLTGDRATAGRLVAHALTRSRGRTGSDTADGDGAGALVRLFLARRPGYPQPHRLLPEMTDVQSALLIAVGTLTRRQWAIVVLRFGQHLTLAEVAGLVDASPSSVAAQLNDAMSQFNEALAAAEQGQDRSWPHSDGEELRALFRSLATQAPGESSVHEAVQRRFAGLRRTRRRAVVAICGLLLAGLGASVSPNLIIPRLAGTPRPAGTWNSFLQLTTPAEWAVNYREISPDSESVRFTHTFPDGSSQGCNVTIWTAGAVGDDLQTAPQPGDAGVQLVRVHSRPGFYRSVPGSPGAATDVLTWQYARNAYARLSCELLQDRKLLYSIASSWIGIGKTVVRLPYAIQTPPTGYRVHSVTVGYPESGSGSRVVQVRLSSATTPNWELFAFFYATRGQDSGMFTQLRALADGRPAVTASDSNGAVSCFQNQDNVCVAASWTGDGSEPKGGANALDQVLDVLAGLTLASRIGDESTWFEADSALG